MMRIRRLSAALFIALLAAAPLAAQTVPLSDTVQPAPGVDATLAEMRKLVERQQDLLEAQARRLEGLSTEITGLKKQIADTGAVALAARNDVADLKKQPAASSILQAVDERLTAVEQQVQRTPELQKEVKTAAEFPGSLRIPGTDAAFKVGGQARMTLVHTLAALGTDDRFVTSSIPVAQPTAGEDARTVYAPQPSRMNFELRSPSGLGPLRTFMEADFAGPGNSLRLRHAFLQMRNWTVGQTWSTFSDPEAEPIGIDFEGLNAISLFRQPQVRYSRRLRETLGLALALENPAPDLTDAQGVSLIPDFIARLRWEPEIPHHGLLGGRAAHVQAAILARQLRGELTDQPDVTLSTGGFGLNVSGVLTPRWDPDDRVKFASNNGWGIGRYITDLGTLGGQDAVFDPTSNTLRALPVWSAYFGYERMWRPTFTSALTYGVVGVTNLDIQPGDALKRTQRTTINLTWTPVPQADFVLEFLAGTRVNKDGQHGESSQIQAGWTFRF
jgi:hypothetical protein